MFRAFFIFFFLLSPLSHAMWGGGYSYYDSRGGNFQMNFGMGSGKDDRSVFQGMIAEMEEEKRRQEAAQRAEAERQAEAARRAAIAKQQELERLLEARRQAYIAREQKNREDFVAAKQKIKEQIRGISTYSLKKRFPEATDLLKAKLEKFSQDMNVSDCMYLNDRLYTLFNPYEDLSKRLDPFESQALSPQQKQILQMSQSALETSFQIHSQETQFQKEEPIFDVALHKKRHLSHQLAEGGLQWLEDPQKAAQIRLKYFFSDFSRANFRDFYELITGVDLVTGEKINPKDHVFSGVSMLGASFMLAGEPHLKRSYDYQIPVSYQIVHDLGKTLVPHGEKRSIRKFEAVLDQGKQIVETAREVFMEAPRQGVSQITDLHDWKRIHEFLGAESSDEKYLEGPLHEWSRFSSFNPFTQSHETHRIFCQQNNGTYRSVRFSQDPGTSSHYALEGWTPEGQVLISEEEAARQAAVIKQEEATKQGAELIHPAEGTGQAVQPLIPSSSILKERFPEMFRQVQTHSEEGFCQAGSPHFQKALGRYEQLAKHVSQLESQGVPVAQQGALWVTQAALEAGVQTFFKGVQQCALDGKSHFKKSTLFFSEVSSGGVDWLENHQVWLEKGLDLATSMTPGVSLFRDFYELVTGKHLVTGEVLSTEDRVFAGVGVLTAGAGSKLKYPVKLLSKFEKTKVVSQGGGKIFQEGAEAALKQGKEIVEAAKRLGVPDADINRMMNSANHILGPKKIVEHKLEGFLKKFSGDQIHALKSLEESTQALANEGRVNNVFETTVLVKNTLVTVKGRVVNGVVKIGTAYTP